MTELTIKQDQHEVRLEKLKKWRENCTAYPNQINNTACAKELLVKYNDMTKAQLEDQKINVQLSGRIMTQRLMGKASFAHIQDGSGEQIQCYFRTQDVGIDQFEFYKTFDLGDIIYVEAYVFKTKTNELSLYVLSFKLLAKSLWPLPDKFHGLQDKESRYRKRYLDLMVNKNSREVFKIRSKVVNAIRNFLTNNDFMEVETPMMQALAGGAAAKPFMTHHNALDMSLFLRIAPELYLKRLIVGGFDRVFELNRNFRNEGISTRHNPEFTMVEFYQAYATYEDLINFTELLLRYVSWL